MKRIFLIIYLFLTTCLFAGEFKWARVKFDVVETDTEETWRYADHVYNGNSQLAMKEDFSKDEAFLKELERLTTIKTDGKVHVVTLDNLEELCNYSMVFMHGGGTPKLSEKEKKNLKAYMERGGFVFADDCINYGVDDIFFRGYKKLIKELFGREMEVLPLDHPIYSCHFQLTNGFPCMQGPRKPAVGLHDKENRLMTIAACGDLHCEWGKDLNRASKTKIEDCFRMGINIVVYVLTH